MTKAERLFNKSLDLAEEKEGEFVEPSDAVPILEEALEMAKKSAEYADAMAARQADPYL